MGICYRYPMPCSCCNHHIRDNKAKPQISIVAGDDTGVMGINPITVSFKTELDLEGCAIIFSFLGFTKKFENLQKDEHGVVTMTIYMSAEQTSEFPLGFQYASIIIEDSQGKRFTLTDDILVLVTDDTEEAKTGNTIIVEVHGGTDASTLLNGVSWNEGGTIGSLREFLAKVGRALGANITE